MTHPVRHYRLEAKFDGRIRFHHELERPGMEPKGSHGWTTIAEHQEGSICSSFSIYVETHYPRAFMTEVKGLWAFFEYAWHHRRHEDSKPGEPLFQNKPI